MPRSYLLTVLTKPDANPQDVTAMLTMAWAYTKVEVRRVSKRLHERFPKGAIRLDAFRTTFIPGGGYKRERPKTFIRTPRGGWAKPSFKPRRA